MAYDSLNRMTSVSGPGVSETFAYRGDKWHRARATSGGVTTYFLYDGDNVVQDQVGGATARVYVTPFLDQNLSMFDVSSSGRYYYSQDGLGSVRTLTSAAGSLTNTYDYTAFGTPHAPNTTETVTQRYTYTGREATTDPGLMYYRTRPYAIGLGRMLNRNPWGYVHRERGNLYDYVSNRPSRWLEPFSHETELHHLVPDWFAHYTAYGPRAQGIRYALGVSFHRLSSDGTFNLEAGLTRIRVALRTGRISQWGAYNRILLHQIRNLPGIIRSNRAAVAGSGGTTTAVAWQGGGRALIAQLGYTSWGQAAMGAGGLLLIGGAAYGYYDVQTEIWHLEQLAGQVTNDADNHNRVIAYERNQGLQAADDLLGRLTPETLCPCGRKSGLGGELDICQDEFRGHMESAFAGAASVGFALLANNQVPGDRYMEVLGMLRAPRVARAVEWLDECISQSGACCPCE